MMASIQPPATPLIPEDIFCCDRPWKTLLRLYRPESRTLLLGAFWYLFKSCPLWIVPLCVAAVIDALAKPRAQAVPIIFWCGLAGMAAIVQNIASHTLYMRKVSQAARAVEARLRLALCGRLQELSISFYHFQSPGRLQLKVLRDVENIDLLVRQLIELICVTAVTLAFTLLITAWRAPYFLPFYILTVPAVMLLRSLMQGRLRAVNQDFRSEIEAMSSSVSGMIEMVPMTRAHGVEQTELKKVEDTIGRLREVGHRLDFQNALFGSTSWVLFTAIYLLGLLLAAAASVMGVVKLSAGEIVMLSGFFNTIASTVMGLANAMPTLSRGFESVRSAGEIMECPDLEQNRGKPAVAGVRGEFSLENVSFVYPNQRGQPALEGVTLHIPAGATVGVQGSSGSGKSTLMGLLLGFQRPSSGRILLDGRDMNEVDLRSYRRFVAVVAQDTVLFPGTLRENLLYGTPGVTPEQLRRALADACALGFVEKLPQGLETMAGERGAAFSGGQRQRLAIARALIRDPRVLILDEATSSLDAGSESAVQEALERLMQGRTTFIVAHRLAATRRANILLRIVSGRITREEVAGDAAARPVPA